MQSAITSHPQEQRRLETINELSLIDERLETSFTRAVQLVRDVLRVPMAAFSVLGQHRCYFRVSVGLKQDSVPRASAFSAYTILGEGLMEVHDAGEDPRFADNPLVRGAAQVRFYAGLPVRAPNGLPVGTVCAFDKLPRSLSTRQKRQLADIRLLVEELLAFRSLAIRDPLTGLFNRRYLDESIQREWRRSMRRKLPLSVLMLDVDYFRRYNDVLGHGAGDVALQGIAGLLGESVLRGGDLLARYGGEAFVVLLPDTPRAGAEVFGERICAAVREANFPHQDSPYARLTISVGGVTCFEGPRSGCPPSELLAVADKCLHKAKHRGRNTVVVEPAPPSEVDYK